MNEIPRSPEGQSQKENEDRTILHRDITPDELPLLIANTITDRILQSETAARLSGQLLEKRIPPHIRRNSKLYIQMLKKNADELERNIAALRHVIITYQADKKAVFPIDVTRIGMPHFAVDHVVLPETQHK